MTKQRDLIFKKFDGRCAYCGCELTKGWHVDEIMPVHRKRKYIKAGWDSDKPRPKSENDTGPEFAKWREARWVADGCEYPERLNIDNQYPACASCNINKHSMSLGDFRKLIQGFMTHLNERSVQYKIAKRYGLVQETIKPVVFYFESVE
jgi:5-methylcytosine-specific restriction endonuclease McrA